jgi:hypothetical protein
VREVALPSVAHLLAPPRELVPPAELRALEPAAGPELPLGLGGQGLPRPAGIGLRVLERHVDHRVLREPAQGALGSARVGLGRTATFDDPDPALSR